jgi:hypothetical protein
MLLDMSDKELRSRFRQNFIDYSLQAPSSEAISKSHSKDFPETAAGKQPRGKVLLVVIVVVVLGLTSGAYILLKPTPPSNKSSLLGQSISRLVSIPVYYPQDLPSGYIYNNDAKPIKANILYFSVTSPNNQTFYVSQQPIPASFDFVGFNKKFLNPDNFSSDAGSAVAGPVGANLICSILTNKNTWIIINSPSTDSLTEIETIARSLELAH